MTHYHHNSRIYLVDREEPKPKDFPPGSPHDIEWSGYDHNAYSKALDKYIDYVLNQTSYECRVEGLRESTATEGKDFVWRYEWMPGVSPVWIECTEEEYNIAPDNLRRKVAVAPPVQPSTIRDPKWNPKTKTAKYHAPFRGGEVKNQQPSTGKQAENKIVGEDMICPMTGKHCDDECCTIGSECNVSGNKLFPGKQEGEVKVDFEKLKKDGQDILSGLKLLNGIRDWLWQTGRFKSKDSTFDQTASNIYEWHRQQPPSATDSAEGKDPIISAAQAMQWLISTLDYYNENKLGQLPDIEGQLPMAREAMEKLRAYATPPVSAQQIGDAFAAGVINAQRQKAGKDFITQDQYLASLPSAPAEGYTAGDILQISEEVWNALWKSGNMGGGQSDKQAYLTKLASSINIPIRDTAKQWNQYKISEWCENIFGPVKGLNTLAARSNTEMAELLFMISKVDPAEITTDQTKEVAEEIADVVICLTRLANCVGVNLQQAIDLKMEKNSNREWKLDGHGHGQHK